jgi:cytochrome d ubiquinol oxidase subunit II
VLIAVLWTGFFVLEGFDFGVGMLHLWVGRSEPERQAAINTIGPFWDGNEVWLIVAGAAIFAAFPAWYATMFSGLYLALVLILVALMARGVSFEYRTKGSTPQWRTRWSLVLAIGSAVAPLLIGVGLGDLLHGLPINKNGDYTGNFFNLLTPYGLFTGITLLVLCLLDGAAFLSIKTTDAVRERSRSMAGVLSAVAVVVAVVWVVWTQAAYGHSAWGAGLGALVVIAAAVAAWLVKSDQDGWAFAMVVVAMASALGALFVDLYPNVMVSSTAKAFDLTVSNSAAGEYALQVMTVVAAIFLPMVLIYQAWNYYVFRKRVSAPPST